MYYRKKPQEDIPMEKTAIWICQNENCKSWMRDDFSFADVPTCGLCHSVMVRGEKMLPVLVNSTHKWKTSKTGTGTQTI